MSVTEDEEGQIMLSVCIVRHGLREDFINKTWRAEHPSCFNDPPLAEAGLQQARETGEFLQRTYSAEASWSKESRVLVSPFLRTKQTGSEIARALGVSQLGVESGLAEWFNESDRVNGGFEHSLFTPRPPEKIEPEFRAKLLSDDPDYKTIVPSEETVPLESIEHIHERCSRLITTLTSNAQRPTLVQQGFPLLVLVTHAAPLVSLIMGAFQSESITSSISACVCSVVRIDVIGNGDGAPRLRLVWPGRTDHLSTGPMHHWDFSHVK